MSPKISIDADSRSRGVLLRRHGIKTIARFDREAAAKEYKQILDRTLVVFIVR